MEAKVMEAAVKEAYGRGADWQRIAAKSGYDSTSSSIAVLGRIYICGEETAMIESLEGQEGHSRAWKTAISWGAGLYGLGPTTSN